MSELRHLIRSIIVEELAKTGGRRVAEETVAIGDDADLMAFVRKLLSLAEDNVARSEILSGRRVFRLAAPAHPPAPISSRPEPAARAPAAAFEAGVVTEKDVAGLDAGTTAIRVGRSTRFTPLAYEEMRRRGITVERETP